MSLSLSSMASPEKRGREVSVYFAEGMPWLPSQVVHDHEAFDKKAHLGLAEQHLHHHNRHNYHDQLRSPKFYGSKSLLSPHYISRTKGVKNWVSGGHGMQAVFLDSAQKSRGGTGVFLPQRAGTDFHSKKKPVCAPVLLPNRVIQALNLNVHALGLHISPKDRHRKRFRSGHEDDDSQDCMSPRDKISGSKVDEQCYIISENQTNSSPELCLPNEWTY
ncbi:PREDICTED: uncharacterized protein LOC101291982 [Fragaria vesca subsp. vesca]|uniref:uncharacterized protein LOC101291982 n=1 Tax=Fragaria vesca subsp. vesca TaxID=101020 RepID=UPI0002C36347|nr:PREDICTED: uncharacterized protein LOC101291982 [Fragaria vesca subsp. vesca]